MNRTINIKRKSECTIAFVACAVAMVCTVPAAWAQENDSEERIQKMEQRLQELQNQVQELKQQESKEEEAEKAAPSVSQEDITTIKETTEKLQRPGVQALFAEDSWVQRFTLGGYGELHANFNQGSAEDQYDLHRLVGYVGYDFADWIKLHSEIELEHALAKDADGKVVVEQAYVDFLLSQPFNIRVGRVLTPLGIINKKHEPTTFNGVERPSFTHDIIPTTWPQDGIGAFGQITDKLSYEAYLTNGLDGSNMDADGGLRGGRMTERPGLNEAAVSGRMDYQLLDQLRLGASGYVGGLNNEDEGGESGVDTNVRILSADFEWSVQDFDFRGVIAHNEIDDEDELLGAPLSPGTPGGESVGEEMFGWYLEAAYHFWPQAWRKGKLENADATAFVRYDDWDTHYETPDGVASDDTLDRDEVTVGVDFKPVQNFVVKADYQFRDHDGAGDPGDGFNLGVGWEF